MLSLLAALAVQSQVTVFAQTDLRDPDGGKSRLMFQTFEERLARPKLSPKKFGAEDPRPWEFDWLTPAFAQVDPNQPAYLLRFRVYSQERRSEGDLAPMVARQLLRMLDFNIRRLGLDHKRDINQGIVDVYLCWGGVAGGEQLFDSETVGGQRIAVNTIYIYDLASFTDPVERAREIAHEYGHATLPAVGGFGEPEDWANGNLGEKLYLRYLRDRIASGKLRPIDAMGASATQLDAWVKRHVDPLVLAAASSGPQASLLAGTGRQAMNHYLGLALYASAILPDRVFGRSLLLGTLRAADYPAALVMAAEEQTQYTLRIPVNWQNRSVWIPLGRGRVSGASIHERRQGWARVQVGNAPIIVRNPPVEN